MSSTINVILNLKDIKEFEDQVKEFKYNLSMIYKQYSIRNLYNYTFTNQTSMIKKYSFILCIVVIIYPIFLTYKKNSY